MIKKLFVASALDVVLTTSVGSSFNLYAPGAFSFENPLALSFRDESVVLFAIVSVVWNPMQRSLADVS